MTVPVPEPVTLVLFPLHDEGATEPRLPTLDWPERRACCDGEGAVPRERELWFSPRPERHPERAASTVLRIGFPLCDGCDGQMREARRQGRTRRGGGGLPGGILAGILVLGGVGFLNHWAFVEDRAIDPVLFGLPMIPLSILALDAMGVVVLLALLRQARNPPLCRV